MSFVNKQLLTYLITRRCAWRAAGRGRSSVFDGHSRLTPSRRRGDSNLASRVIKRRDNKGLTHSVLDERSDASETRPRNDPILCRVEWWDVERQLSQSTKGSRDAPVRPVNSTS